MTTYTKSHASKILSTAEMVLFSDSRITLLRTFSASQLDRRLIRARTLRDRARDLLQRQRLASQDATGSKRGLSGDDNSRTREKHAILADIVRRFEGRLTVARKLEQGDAAPGHHPKRHVTRKAAKTRRTAPNRDFTGARMRGHKRDVDEAAAVMAARQSGTRVGDDADMLAPLPARKAVRKKPAKKTAAKKAAKPVAKAVKTVVASKAPRKAAKPAASAATKKAVAKKAPSQAIKRSAAQTMH